MPTRQQGCSATRTIPDSGPCDHRKEMGCPVVTKPAYMQTPPASSGKVFHSVTTVRGLAALAVCWFHMSIWTGLIADGWLLRSGMVGWLGPHIFFIVSGFVVPWSLYVVRYRLPDAPRYLARRIIRLDPPYFMTIAAAVGLLVVQSNVGATHGNFELDWARLLSHLAYLTAIVGEYWYNPVFWTLAIEFQFYLLLAVIAPLLFSRRRDVRWAVMAIGLAAFAPWCEVPELSWLPVAEHPGSIWVTGYMPLFMLGFLLFQYNAGLIRKSELWCWAAPLFLLAATYTYVLGLLAILAFTVMLADRIRNPVTEFLGRISYSLYLVHLPAGIPIQLVARQYMEPGWIATSVVFLSVAFSIFAAWVFYLCVERPSMRLARRVSLRSTPPHR